MERIEMDLGFATLVVERGADKDYREVIVSLEDKNGVWLQNIAVVGQKYRYNDDYEIIQDKGINVLVYADANSVETIEDPEYKAYVEDAPLEEFMITRLSETYNMWDSWWVEGDVDEEGNEVTPYKTTNGGK